MVLGRNDYGCGTEEEMALPGSEVGEGAFRQWKYAQRHPSVWAEVLVSSWGEQSKLIGFRMSDEREWHVAGSGSGHHWCKDC